ncbi:MAG: HoxN/HupN/NixA family nickel/cobalt transporter [Mycobacterium sp.]|uniref:HoxN/HupN/NixA family nickel/cobalt transporter n=1 Tax=Mycobacterium sp. TaxID=1785 RepID=UPI0026183CA6|nr:HoxN/HupN/NixA family nickel/cobalt transporter [Mycobacterium sp.]MDI3315411.1 HoxN/HupN/NixA family nickel/cobalt transporter [Mycobacterium sp.]
MTPESHSVDLSPAGVFCRHIRSWNRRDLLDVAVLAAAIGLLHLVGFGALVLIVAPHRYQVGTQVFGIGLGVTAYTFGLRHAIDVDHIAAIDNTTRKLTADAKKPKAVGFWFAMGHSMMVLALAVLVSAGTKAAGVLLTDDSSARRTLGVAGTLASGGFLYLIGIINAVSLIGIWRVLHAMRRGQFDERELEDHLNNRGFLGRILRPIMKRITRPVQMFPVGALFGLGFDTATEVALFALAGTGAAAGLPWYAVLTLPIVFAAGMSLMDTADGLLMTLAYDWAFAHPARKIFYNLAITGLSVAIALLIGTIELVSVLHDNLGWVNPATDWISALSLNNVGFIVVGLFVATWACAIAYWRLTDSQHRWQTNPSGETGQ